MQSSFQRDMRRGKRFSVLKQYRNQKLFPTLQMHNCWLSFLHFIFSHLLQRYFSLRRIQVSPSSFPSWICDKIRDIVTELFPLLARLLQTLIVSQSRAAASWMLQFLNRNKSAYKIGEDHRISFYISSVSNNSIDASYRDRWGCSVYSSPTVHLLQRCTGTEHSHN